ncbi:hypothetical protein N7532_006991 [Penicillium argentinense]|uniref:DDE-1 domain-containing protein n=2 Tax=Penicillium argentinense TaxID=1131581 RepID=A0A9W9KBB6_9EURO|nr:uncharacterized protein N7532_006991 [Penicillium argentinense]KAJ5099990.1 hypothetical protein N7532_006991 [Penicillium argentinense]
MSSDRVKIEQQIAKAVEYTASLKSKPNLSKIAREYGVPYQRFRARLQGRQALHAPKPYQETLDPWQIQGLVHWWKFFDSVGYRPSHQEIIAAANHILAPESVGKMWVYRFEERHLKPLGTRIARHRPVNKKRLEAEDVGMLEIWYGKLREYLHCDGNNMILTHNIYNFDETGFMLGVGKTTRGPSQYSDKRFASLEKGTLVSVIECACADGTMVEPPYIIFPGARHMESWYEGNVPNYPVNVSETGYSNGEIALDWIKLFDKQTYAKAAGKQRLLLFDGHPSHITVEFLQYCQDNNIIAWNFMSNLTQLCQPLDQKPFVVYKQAYKAQTSHLQAEGRFDDTIHKGAFLHQLPDLRKRVFQRSTIRHAFRDTGLVPYNPDLILGKVNLGLTSNITVTVDEGWLANTPSPPPQSSSPLPSSPIKTPRSARRVVKKILNKDISNNPQVVRGLDLLCDGLLANVERNRHLEQSFQNHFSAPKQRTKRQVQGKGLSSITGRLYPHDAQNSIIERKAREQKAAEARAAKDARPNLGEKTPISPTEPPRIEPKLPSPRTIRRREFNERMKKYRGKAKVYGAPSPSRGGEILLGWRGYRRGVVHPLGDDLERVGALTKARVYCHRLTNHRVCTN